MLHIPTGEAASNLSIVEEAIELANNDIMADIAHHCDWLNTQRPGAGLAFLRHLAGAAGLAVEETAAAANSDQDAISAQPRTAQVIHIGGKTIVVPSAPLGEAA